jgi:4-hydroxybenzoate polyprenyltransferase
MKRLLDFLVYSNIFLAAGASVVAFTTIFLMGFPIETVPLFIPFAGAMFIYNLNRMTDSTEDLINVPKRISFVRRNGKFFLAVGIVLYGIAIMESFLRNLNVFLAVIAPGIISIFYSIFRLKRFYITKNLLVALAWGMTPVVVGFYFETFDLAILSISLFFTLEFFINTVIFDVKDIKGDYLYKIKTLPTVIGTKNTKHMCLIINFFSGMILLLSILYSILPLMAIILIPFLLYIFAYIILCDSKNGLFYGAFVDGEFMFLALIVLLAYMVF